MELKQINDLVIPHKKIGVDKGWEQELQPILEAFADNWNCDASDPVSPEAIAACETLIETTLPQDLKQFHLQFGDASLPEQLLTIEEIDYLEAFWDPDTFTDKLGTEGMELFNALIVFSDYLGSGNYWCFHRDSLKVYYFSHDTAPYIHPMFNSFSEYLNLVLIRAQMDLTGDDALKKEITQLLVQLTGEDKYRIWHYANV